MKEIKEAVKKFLAKAGSWSLRKDAISRKVQGVAASIVVEAVASYLEYLFKIISGWLNNLIFNIKEHIFSIDKISFFWKKMPLGLS